MRTALSPRTSAPRVSLPRAFVSRALRVLALAAALPCALHAHAAHADDAIRVELVPRALQGAGQPQLVVHVQANLRRVEVDLVRSVDAKPVRCAFKQPAPGKAHPCALTLTAPGSARFTGKIVVEEASGQRGELPIDVEAALLEPIVLTVTPEDVDLAAKRLVVRANRPLAAVELTLTADDGGPLGTREIDAGGAARVELPIEPERAATILRIGLRGRDADGFFGGLELFPWRVDIPHEEVLFASGSDVIDAPEQPKLDASYQRVADAVKKFGKLAPIKLFVAGHTDTVGDSASNRALSERRARAIARAFRKKGLKIPVLSAGFGEDVPIVETPDETDEARNRRAEYIVAVDAPSIRGRSPWAPVP